MAQTWDDSLDSPSAYDQCPSFAGGQFSYARPRQLQPDQAVLLQDVEVAITGAAISRRGTQQLGGSVGASGAIRALDFFKTPVSANPVAVAGSGTFYFNGTVWVTLAKTVSTSHDINFAQGIDKLFLADGVDLFQYNGAIWTTISTVGSNATAPRGATLVLWFTNRLIVGGIDIKNEAAANVPDAIYLSNFLDATTWDDVAHGGAATKDGAQIRVGAGDGAANVALVPWQNYNIAVFKRHSVYIVVADPTLAIADMPVQLVHSTVGCVASRTACQVGADIFFLSDDGVRSLEATAGSDQQHETGLPLSYPVQDIINRINWQYADRSAATFWRNLYLISLPLDSSTTPNYILIYNVLTSKWNGIWTNIPASCFHLREDSSITKLMIGLASTNKVIEYLDYVNEEDADDDTYTDFDADYVLPRIKTRSFYFNDPISPKLGMGSEIEWNDSKGHCIATPILDERTTAAVDFDLGSAQIVLPFLIPVTFPFVGLTRRSHDLMRYGEFRELQYDFTTTGAGRKELRQITSNAIIMPSLVGFGGEVDVAAPPEPVADQLYVSITVNSHTQTEHDFLQLITNAGTIGILMRHRAPGRNVTIYGTSGAVAITSPSGLLLDTDYVVDLRLTIVSGTMNVIGRISGASFGSFDDPSTAVTSLRVGVMGSIGTVHLNMDNVLVGTTAFGSSDLFSADFASAIVPPFDSTTGSGLSIVSGTLDASNSGADAYATKAITFP